MDREAADNGVDKEEAEPRPLSRAAWSRM